ncbi:MAG: hypothetical protein [Inoviridae sp.]|nr:MAG: hypothetical protein [Inoviridae sp.]
MFLLSLTHREKVIKQRGNKDERFSNQQCGNKQNLHNGSFLVSYSKQSCSYTKTRGCEYLL